MALAVTLPWCILRCDNDFNLRVIDYCLWKTTKEATDKVRTAYSRLEGTQQQSIVKTKSSSGEKKKSAVADCVVPVDDISVVRDHVGEISSVRVGEEG